MSKDTLRTSLIAWGERVEANLAELNKRKAEIEGNSAKGEEPVNDRLKLLMIQFDNLPYIFQLSILNTLLFTTNLADGMQKFIGKNH